MHPALETYYYLGSSQNIEFCQKKSLPLVSTPLRKSFFCHTWNIEVLVCLLLELANFNDVQFRSFSTNALFCDSFCVFPCSQRSGCQNQINHAGAYYSFCEGIWRRNQSTLGRVIKPQSKSDLEWRMQRHKVSGNFLHCLRRLGKPMGSSQSKVAVRDNPSLQE